MMTLLTSVQFLHGADHSAAPDTTFRHSSRNLLFQSFGVEKEATGGLGFAGSEPYAPTDTTDSSLLTEFFLAPNHVQHPPSS